MRRTSALAFALAALLTRAAQAQDFPPFPPESPKPSDEDDQTALWFRDPNTGYGPFHYVSLSLFPSLRSGFETHFPDSLASGGFELRVNESWVKNFSSTDRWLVDFELLRSNIGFSWGLSESLRLDLAIESAGRTGGTLDAFILGFHQSFGLAVGRLPARTPRQAPRSGPYLRTAAIMYSLQLGWNRQTVGSTGRKQYW